MYNIVHLLLCYYISCNKCPVQTFCNIVYIISAICIGQSADHGQINEIDKYFQENCILVYCARHKRWQTFKPIQDQCIIEKAMLDIINRKNKQKRENRSHSLQGCGRLQDVCLQRKCTIKYSNAIQRTCFMVNHSRCCL